MDEFSKKCKIERNEKLGRYVIATEDIKEGETVLLERPVLILPNAGDKRCSNCLHLTSDFCSICQILPLCQKCTKHNEYDCERFAKMSDIRTTELQECIGQVYGILKTLLLRDNDETRPYYDQLIEMEAHMAQRRDSAIWKRHEKRVIGPLLSSGVIKYFNEKSPAIDSELLQQLCAIIDVNNFEFRAPDEGSMCAIFIRGAMLNHSCVSNTAIAVDEQYRIKIYANQNIAKGEMLFDCYTNVLLCTDERRQVLKTGKYFDCNCPRCSDPTELGSHMSTLICAPCAQQKREGLIIQKEPQKWECQTCGHALKPDYVAKLLERTKEEIFHATGDIYRYELLLAKISRVFHTNHYLLIDLKQNIAAILRSIIMNLAEEPGRKVYERKVRLCQEIVSVLQIIQPGISRLKAIALYESCNASAELSRLRFKEKDITEEELVEQLQETSKMLREAIRMLLYEPIESPEGQLAKGMLRELKDLQTDIKMIQKNSAS